MNDIIEKHRLAEGNAVWIQRIKIPGVRKPKWSVVVSGLGFTDAPEITDCRDKGEAYGRLADILKADVMEEQTR